LASDKLFYWVFQQAPERILQLQADLPADADYRFSAPVLKEREYRLDGHSSRAGSALISRP
jgi:predicted transposase YdaD